MKLLSGNSNLPLAHSIAEYLGVPLILADIKRFSDMEIFVEIQESVRGEHVFLIQSTSYPANDHMMELLIMIDALRRGSAERITVVIPYFGYARQDRKSGPRTPISAKLVANLITTAGADRVVTLDLHAGQIQGFFDIPVDNLFAIPVFAQDIKIHHHLNNVVVVSPDVGGVIRARSLSNRLHADLAIIDKRRESAGLSEVMHIIGSVKGCQAILVDDIVDSGGTLCNAAFALQEAGAEQIFAYITHGVFSKNAITKLENAPFNSVVTTDSIYLENTPKSIVRHISIAPLLGQAIQRIVSGGSVSSLFL
jgi:ribose-phosphate pyrophosphokinase